MEDMYIPICFIFLHNVQSETKFFMWIICE